MTKKNIEFVVDAHVHCGKGYSFKEYSKEVENTPINRAIIFPLAFDIYHKSNKNFQDNRIWKERRRNANKHVLSLSGNKEIKIDIYPFKFVWNDFNMEDIDRYFGVKWHRRNTDPKYKIGSFKFAKLIDKLKIMKMPIIFEDESENIIKFINQWSEGINVIVPHLGFGGRNYYILKEARIWDRENVYTDTSYATDISMDIILKHIKDYGYKRIFFGSDYPNSHPQEEVEKILSINISYKAKKAITSGNILRLLKGIKKPKK